MVADILAFVASRARFASVHSDDPGDTGANETSLARAPISWEVTDGVLRIAAPVLLDVPAGPVNHFGLWTDTGRFSGSGELPEVIFTTQGVYLLDSVDVILQPAGVAA
jgi:hypothetical protein